MTISTSESKFIIEGCRDGCRVDGRSRKDFRLYSSVVGDFALSHGSARIFLATKETHLLVSVKAELVVPASSAPMEGAVEVHVDYLQGNNNSSRDDDLESTLSNLLVPHLVDKEKLCIAPNYFVWKLNIDVFVITSGGGSLIDACSQGIHAALQQTMLPRLSVGPASEGRGNKPTIQVDSDIKVAEHIPGVENAPIIVTVSLLRHRKTPVMIVDATGEEETCAFARVHVVLDRGKSSSSSKKKGEPMICALHTAGGGALPFALLQDVTSFVLEASGSSRVVVSESLHHLLQDNFSIQQ
jgi:exosome complex RNA-binding protein Rrp42 (RNase PH superfamily)